MLLKTADPVVSVSKQVRRGVPEKQIDTKHSSIGFLNMMQTSMRREV